MNICVLGIWHLGSVTAACLATLGHRVVGVDFDEKTVAALRRGVAPVLEPGLEELIRSGLASGALRFSSTIDDAKNADVLWVTYDTAIDDDDHADTDSVLAQIERVIRGCGSDVLVLVSSQLPVGSIRGMERNAASNAGPRPRFAYSPENLRLGTAVADFLRPKRIVVGVRSDRDRELLQLLLCPIGESVEWMSVESAEMTKHSINAFFATSVAFANEIALLCESLGADAKEVERGLKTETRIGPGAYLAPGAAFGGGTLARDVAFLNQMGRDCGVTTPLLSAVLPSNERHKQWVRQKLRSVIADVSQTTVAVWGLTYKPGTDAMRRSLSVELCDWLVREGATVHVHDPAAANLPERWCGAVKRFDSPTDAIRGAQVLVVATEWPIYRTVSVDQLLRSTEHLVVIDANRFLANLAAAEGRLKYFAVGMPSKET
jgi:UDPglucose 6-dehydrogenase